VGAEGRCRGNQFSLAAIVVIISIQWINVRESITLRIAMVILHKRSLLFEELCENQIAVAV